MFFIKIAAVQNIFRHATLQIFDSLSFTIVVPPEVLKRGPVAIEVYKNALAEGKTILKRMSLMLIGQAED